MSIKNLCKEMSNNWQEYGKYFGEFEKEVFKEDFDLKRITELSDRITELQEERIRIQERICNYIDGSKTKFRQKNSVQ